RVTVCNAFGHETAIAEYILMVMLVWSHRFREIEGDFRTRSSWQPSWVQSGAPHGEILGSTVGIVGLGRVGHEVARRAAAFGCRIALAGPKAWWRGAGPRWRATSIASSAASRCRTSSSRPEGSTRIADAIAFMSATRLLAVYRSRQRSPVDVIEHILGSWRL